MIVRTKEQILGAALTRLVNETDITVTSPGGVARTWFEIAASELGYDFRIMDSNLSSLFPSVAGGDALDKIGTIFGVQRTSSSSSVDKNEGRLYFYLNTVEAHQPGTSDMDATSSITIPAGTLISTDIIDTPFMNVNTWRTTSPCTIEQGAHMAFASVEPVSTTIGTFGAGSLTTHSLDEASYPYVYVYNRLDLEVNETSESDNNFRYRIANAINEAAKGNILALRLAALGTAGVRDCKVIPYSYGVGTVKVVVVMDLPGTAFADSSFVEAAAAVRGAASAGDLIFVERPTETRVDVEAVVTGSVTAATRDAIAGNITRYIAGLSIGDPISSAKITNEAISTSAQVRDFAIMDGGFRFDGTPRVFTKTNALADEQFYPGTITILSAG